MADIWVISDTHFYHENIIHYTGRPFKDALTMNYAIRDNWNSVVKPQDKVYHLGDVYMGGTRGAPALEFLSSLNGHKRLILGNHDDPKDHTLWKVFEKIGLWRPFPEFGLILSHIPLHEGSLYNGKKKTTLLNVHGHIHEKPSPPGPYKNVSVEWIGYTPINLEEIK